MIRAQAHARRDRICHHQGHEGRHQKLDGTHYGFQRRKGLI